MRMLRSCVNVQIAEDLVTKAGLREHSFDGPPYEFGRSLCKDLLRSRETLSTRITGVTDINTIVHLVSLEHDLLGVDHDDVVTAVHVRGVARLVLATEDKSDPGSKTAECQICSIDDEPLFLYSCRIEGILQSG